MNRLSKAVFLFALLGLASLSLLSPGDISLYKITSQAIGSQVSVSGIVLQAIPIKNGTLVTLYNYSSIQVPVFQQEQILPGDILAVKGKVLKYKGELEIFPESVRSHPPEVLEVGIGDISDKLVHKTVRVVGEVVEKGSKSSKMADHRGVIHVFGMDDVEEGGVIELEGLVERYRSVLYIRPRSITRFA